MSSEKPVPEAEPAEDAGRPPTPPEGTVTSAEGEGTVGPEQTGSEQTSSRPGSRPGSAAGSRPGSAAGSRPGSAAGSRPGSAAGSRPGSRPGSRAESRSGSRPGSAAGSVRAESAGEQAEDGGGPGTEKGGPPPADAAGDSAAGGSTEPVETGADGAEEPAAAESSAGGDKPEASGKGEENEKSATQAAGKDGEVEPMEVDETQTSAEKEPETITSDTEGTEKSEDRSVTVIDIGEQEDDKDGDRSSPVKKIRVISSATVSLLDEDDPVLVPTEDTNGDVMEVTEVMSDKNKSSGADVGPTRTNGPASDGEGDAPEPVTVLSENSVLSSDAASGQATLYGIVSPIYKDPTVLDALYVRPGATDTAVPAVVSAGGKQLRPLAVRPGTVQVPVPVVASPGTGTAGTGTAGTGTPVSVTPSTAGLVAGARKAKCIICKWVKPIKYMMMANGSNSGNVICSDECLEKCVNNVKSGRMNIMADGSAASTSSPAPAPSGPALTVASVTSLSAPSVTATPAPAQPSPPAPAAPAAPAAAAAGADKGRSVCQNAECGRPILSTATGRELRTVWETLVFCTPSCAVQHQKKDGSFCVFCKLDLPEMIMGKYCVRFGSDVRQFCSNLCLDGFKKRLKVCSYCQRDITRFQGSFLAPVGNAGSHQFKEFCSQSCLTRYKTTHSELAKNHVTWAKCSVCLKNTPIEHKVAVKPNEPVKMLCSQICLKAYKFAIKDEGPLETCAACKTLLAVNNMAEFRVWNGGSVANLCSQSCSNVYVLSNRRIVSCRYCKVKKYNFDMMEVISEKDGLYCSVHCLKNCGKRIGPRRDKRAVCAHCGTAVDATSFSGASGNANVFCGTKCAQAKMKEKNARGKGSDSAPAASNGVGTLGGLLSTSTSLPQIQSVISLADDDDDASAANASSKTSSSPATTTAGKNKPGRSSRTRTGNPKAGSQTPGLLPAARDHPALVLMPPAPVSRRNVCVQVQPKKDREDRESPERRIEKEEKETATMATQTEPTFSADARILPIPIPMYVPAPMAMYNCPYPVPLPVAMPVPVPLLLGAEDALRLLCGVPAVHPDPQQLPTEPGGEQPSPADRPAPVSGKRRRSSGSSAPAGSPGGPEPDGGSDWGGDASPAASPGSPASPAHSGGDGDTDCRPPPHKRRKGEDPVAEDSSPPSPRSPSPAEADGDLLDLLSLLRPPPPSRPAEGTAQGDDTTTAGGQTEEQGGGRRGVKYTWCVRVFEQFIQQRNRRPPPGSDSDSARSSSPDSETRQRLVADPLQATPTELAAGLRAMTRELTRPGGEKYPPDIIHYILLGIQLYLLEHRRWDSLFWSDTYGGLAAALEERLKPVTVQLCQAELEPRACRQLTTHVEESHLWEAKVLGAHSPQALITTVVFFVTKHFLLGSLQWHQKLTFAMLQESVTLKSRLQQSSLKLLDSRNVYKRSKTYEMPANAEDPFRCPVRFLEFYLSRCPESTRTSRSSPLYLSPAADGRPDGSVWFSQDPLPSSALQQLLGRLLTVRELQTALLTDVGS